MNVSVGFVGGEKIRHFNNARPFWNKCLFIGMVWFTDTQEKTTLVEHIPTTINEDPTAPPSFLVLTKGKKHNCLQYNMI
jgi:hypothetical protein